MKMILTTAAVVATAGLLGASPAAAQGTLDQSFTNASSAIAVHGAIQLAQTFTAGRTGILTEVDLTLETQEVGNPPIPPPLTVEIETADANHQPSGTVLASTTIPASAVLPGVFRWTPAVFSAPPFVVAGTQYAIVLADPADTAPLGSPFVTQYGDNTYSGGYGLVSMDSGTTWFHLPGYALVFKTYVESEPTSIDRCKDGGWRQFGFKNQGQCVAFVILSRVCDAFERHGNHLKFCPPTPPVPRQS